MAQYGKRCLLVTVPTEPVFEPLFGRVKELLAEAGVDTSISKESSPIPRRIASRPAQIWPNALTPMSYSGWAGAQVGRRLRPSPWRRPSGHGLGLSLVPGYATQRRHPAYHRGIDYFRHGSQFTQVAVLTNPQERNKSAISHNHVYPAIGIVDPELMVTVPAHVTASTGFDVFTHGRKLFARQRLAIHRFDGARSHPAGGAESAHGSERRVGYGGA